MTTKKQKPLVIIFGRTNVGKSTLFNCLVGKNRALVSPIEGTTRDSNIGEVEWGDFIFHIVDTGGIMDIKKLKRKIIGNSIDDLVQRQARDYILRADLILFLVDTVDGTLPQDKEMVMELKKILSGVEKSKRPEIILTANKADSPKLRKEIAEFNKLSLGEPLAISATTGSGTGDLLDLVNKKIKKRGFKKNSIKKEEDSKEKLNNKIRVCILGKPNVGKSSLINAILDEERIIVSDVPHTTREPQDIFINYQNKDISLVDTAGISREEQKSRRNKKGKEALTKQSIERSLKALYRADVCLFMINIYEGITRQDARIIEEIIERNISMIIVANKWDLVEEKDTEVFKKEIYARFPFCQWAPIQFVSAKTGSKVDKILDLVLEVAEARKTEISANGLSKFLNKIVKWHKPAKAKGIKHPHIYELAQERSSPPIFKIRIGAKDTIHFSYLRFIENRLREKFGFIGAPIKIYVEKNKQIHGKTDKKIKNK
ncbi:MAG: ribosome biogenesis GTPase Der [bacterium]